MSLTKNVGFGINLGFDDPIVVRSFCDSTKGHKSLWEFF